MEHLQHLQSTSGNVGTTAGSRGVAVAAGGALAGAADPAEDEVVGADELCGMFDNITSSDDED